MKEKQISQKSFSIYINQETHQIKGKVYLLDNNGQTLDTMKIEPLKIIRTVYFIFYSDSGEDFKNAAHTRKKEIESLNEFNYVFIFGFRDLWGIKDFTDNALKKIKKNEMDKTREISFFSHCGVDGVVGAEKTSQHSLREQTGYESDDYQMTLEGWSKVNFNLNPNNSIAGFYGCRGVTFAENFMEIQNITYVAAHGGSSADSEEYNNFNPSWYTFDDEKIYYLSILDKGKIAPISISKRGRRKWSRFILNEKLFTNVSLDEKGNLYGWSKEGILKIQNKDIKYEE